MKDEHDCETPDPAKASAIHWQCPECGDWWWWVAASFTFGETPDKAFSNYRWVRYGKNRPPTGESE